MVPLGVYRWTHGLGGGGKLPCLAHLVCATHVAKCNLGKVNLELMLPAVSPSLHMIRGGAPLEFAGANYVQPCLLVIVAITASVSESLRIH